MAYPPNGSSSSSAFAASNKATGGGFLGKLFKGGDRTGIRTTLTRRQVFLVAALVVGIVVGIALAVGLALGLRKNNPVSASTKVVLVCLDGYKPEYLNSGLTPNIKNFFEKGVSAKGGLLPVFPPQSFPNQYSMLTGLYPAYHGIVGDYFHDPKIPSNVFTTFARNESGTVNQQVFWGGVPLWVTLRQNNLDVGTVNWPGTSAKPFNTPPTYDQPFNKSQTDAQRVSTLLSWIGGVNNLDGTSQAKPVFIATHFRDADANGTLFGPDVNNPAFREVLTRVDNNFALLVDGIEKMGLTGSIDVIVVSDHGIASTPNNPANHLFYEDYVDLTQVDIVQNRPMAFVYPKSANFDYNAFAQSIRGKPNVRTYIRGRTDEFAYPAEYSLDTERSRIPPITILPFEGFTFFYKNESFPTRVSLNRNQLGSAGYVADDPDMLGVFAAKGPSFRSALVVGGDKAVIRTLDVYPLLAKLLGVKAEANNGTLEAFAAMFR
ncbi:hypothetical protein HDU67_009760 [Dinochytrium kinnereticum]|nr:hypothetical protein HDU67_009760 [Dinochytrium kinnereticum]